MSRRGYAAAQCGKALPYRRVAPKFWRLRLRFLRRSLKQERTLPERQSLSALCGGKAAVGDC
jgi:hypothetical protein